MKIASKKLLVLAIGLLSVSVHASPKSADCKRVDAMNYQGMSSAMIKRIESEVTKPKRYAKVKPRVIKKITKKANLDQCALVDRMNRQGSIAKRVYKSRYDLVSKSSVRSSFNHKEISAINTLLGHKKASAQCILVDRLNRQGPTVKIIRRH